MKRSERLPSELMKRIITNKKHAKAKNFRVALHFSNKLKQNYTKWYTQQYNSFSKYLCPARRALCSTFKRLRNLNLLLPNIISLVIIWKEHCTILTIFKTKIIYKLMSPLGQYVKQKFWLRGLILSYMASLTLTFSWSSSSCTLENHGPINVTNTKALPHITNFWKNVT